MANLRMSENTPHRGNKRVAYAEPQSMPGRRRSRCRMTASDATCDSARLCIKFPYGNRPTDYKGFVVLSAPLKAAICKRRYFAFQHQTCINSYAVVMTSACHRDIGTFQAAIPRLLGMTKPWAKQEIRACRASDEQFCTDIARRAWEALLHRASYDGLEHRAP